MIIPTWNEVSEMDDKGDDLTALEQFVYNHEPAGDIAVAWRVDLQSLVNYVRSEG